MNIIITGVNGFIGFHLAKELIKQGHFIIGLNKGVFPSNDELKNFRGNTLLAEKNFVLYSVDLCDFGKLSEIFQKHDVDKVIHLAAQSGERDSSIDPFAYTQSNAVGFHHLIELARRYSIKKFLYASTAAVYGGSSNDSLSENDNVDHPLSIYAATKKSNELLAHAYSHLYKLPTIGIRFFTAYGPYGRPDMVLLRFAKRINSNSPIDLYNYGKMQRTFVYIDDVVSGVLAALELDSNYEIFNIGSDEPIQLEYIVELIENNLNKKATKNYLPMQFGDIESVHSNISEAKNKLGWMPKISIEEGVKKTLDWFQEYESNNL